MKKAGNAIVAVIDVQDRLMSAIDCAEEVCDGVERLLKGMSALGVPMVLTEQYPDALGPTVNGIRSLVDMAPIDKLSFSCCGVEDFNTAVAESGKRHVVVTGVETHVCVYQTVRDLLGKGYEVSVVVDAVGSRTAKDKDIGLRRMERLGAQLVSVEMILFDLLERAGSPEFKAVLKVVK